MSGDIIGLIIRCTLAASAAILVVLLMRGPVRRAFGARVAYAFWLLAPAAALASLLPLRSVELASPASAGGAVDPGAGGAAVQMALSPMESAPFALSLSGAALAVWTAGFLAALAALAIREHRFVTGLGLRRVAGGPLYRACDGKVGPALVGVFRPRIVVPADFERRFSRHERALILAHERAHLAAGDAQVNGLAAVAQCLGWFNPLFYVARHYLRVDQELACDERVVRRHGAARRAYAEAMLKSQLPGQAVPLGLHWVCGGAQALRQRIAMLKRPAPTDRRSAVGGALCGVCALAMCAGASAAQPPRIVAADSDGAQRGHFWRDVGAAFDPKFCQRLDFLGCAEAANAIGDSPRRNEAARLGLHLVLALQNGDVERARSFIEAGADVDFFQPGDGTPLVIAAQSRDFAIARMLLEAGADPNRFAPGDGAPLVLASARGDFALVELLVAHGAEVNAVDADNATALIVAARNNRTSVARHLIERGADVNLTPGRRSALAEAERRRHWEMVRLLRGYGAGV